MKLSILSAAGNAFAVLDTAAEGLPGDPASLARALCTDLGQPLREQARAGGLPQLEGRDLDGLLLVLPPEGQADCRMVIHNADGSRPEACGNGLRCVARFAREQGLATGDLVRVETDAGLRSVALEGCGDRPDAARAVSVRASMGVPRVVARREQLECAGEQLEATLIDMGNPHCVLFVEDERRAAVERIGPALERHARFPARTNVEFASLRAEGLGLRVWERGVGETAACGTGACAAAVAAMLEHGRRSPLEVQLPGGRLRVHWDGAGEVWLEGPARLHARGEWSAARGVTP